jgi:dTDP-4-amino-4,6-dideoxy-D-glucose acyltransferase
VTGRAAEMPSRNADFLPRAAIEALGFRALGEDVLIHPSAVLVDCGKIALGARVRIDPFVVLSARGGITIGDNVHLAAHCCLSGDAAIELGDFSGLSQGVRIFASSDDYQGGALTNPTVSAEFRKIASAPIRLGRHAIVGAGSVILPGGALGEGTAVGALSLVHRPLDGWAIYSGVPARRIGARGRDLTELEARYRAAR